MSNIAPGLRDDFDVTAIISTFDDGGSTGRLKEAYGTIAVGDIRQALAALSTNKLGQIFNHRFEKGDVKGHALGNLILTAALEHHTNTQKALNVLHQVLAVKGRVLPVSTEHSVLVAELEDGTIIKGEHVIDEPHEKSDIPIKKVWLEPSAQPADGVTKAIKNADLIIMGPGDIWTSIVPCILVTGIKEAIVNSNAKKIYIPNSFTKYGHTNDYSAYDHVKAIESYLAPNTFNTIIIRTDEIPEEVVQEHANQREKPVKSDIEKLQQSGYGVLSRDLLKVGLVQKSSADPLKRSKIALDPNKLNALIKELCA